MLRYFMVDSTLCSFYPHELSIIDGALLDHFNFKLLVVRCTSPLCAGTAAGYMNDSGNKSHT